MRTGVKAVCALFGEGCKGGKSPLPGRSRVDSAEGVLIVLLGFLGSVVSWDCKPEINNPRIKVPGTAPARSRGDNYPLQLQVTVNSAVSSAVQQQR